MFVVVVDVVLELEEILSLLPDAAPGVLANLDYYARREQKMVEEAKRIQAAVRMDDGQNLDKRRAEIQRSHT